MTEYTNELIESIINEMQPKAQIIENDFSRGISIYGAGIVGTWGAEYLQSIGAKVLYFVDRDKSKEGTRIHNIPVISPEKLTAEHPQSMLIGARHFVKDVEKYFTETDYRLLSFDAYFVIRNYPRIARIRDTSFADGKSQNVFNGILHSMLTSTLKGCRDVMEKDMYFCLPEFSGTFDEIFVDAGAFVGDSVERFIWENLGTFKKIYAFEPGAKQFKALEKRVRRLSEEWAFDPDRIALEKAGLSSKTENMSYTFTNDYPIRHGLFSATEENSNKDSGDTTAEVYSLDNYLKGKEVTLIKVDIEGMEMEFLKGAGETIKKHKPKIAICAYHYPSDLYEIIEYLEKLVPEYKFKFRNHAPIFGDFVVYCYTDNFTGV